MIVVGVDGSRSGANALAWAIEEADQRGTAVTAVRAWMGVSPIIEDTAGAQELIAAQCEKLNTSVERARRVQTSDVPIVQQVAAGEAYDAIALAAAATEAELIVVGRRGLGRIVGGLVGSVSLHCAHYGTRPVVIIPHEEPRSTAPKRIVVGVDTSSESVEALRWGAAEALLWSAPLVVVHAYSPLPFASHDDAHAAALAVCDTIADKVFSGDEPRPTVELLAVEGHPASVLVRQAAGNDLLVVGAPAHHAAAAVLGSVASRCIAHAKSPVVIVRPR